MQSLTHIVKYAKNDTTVFETKQPEQTGVSENSSVKRKPSMGVGSNLSQARHARSSTAMAM